MSKQYQKGQVSILFVMIIPSLFGLYTLGTDGARALQQKARLGDAAEVAVLALTANINTEQTIEKDLVRNIVYTYFPETVKNKIQIQIQKDESNLNQKKYNLQVGLHYDNWFPGNNVTAGFGEDTFISTNSSARKLISKGSMDILFVADLSGSMLDFMPPSLQSKYVDVIEIISDSVIELSKNKINTFGIAPYNHYVVKQKTMNNDCLLNSIGDKPLSIEYIRYENLTVNNYMNLDRIIAEMDDPGNCKERSPETDPEFGGTFFTIPLTSESVTFNELIKGFSPRYEYDGASSYGGQTASINGIIEGYRELKKGDNNIKKLIVLSDGADVSLSPTPDGPITPNSTTNFTYNNMMPPLIKKGLCTDIKRKLSNNETVTADLYFIGFHYKDYTSNIATCFDADKIFFPDDREGITGILGSILNDEEIGSLL